ncbi:MAG: HIT family protein [Phycisphaeraceae bacterium]|nr:HIT family protein [Phycisphaeraceae bacterium]
MDCIFCKIVAGQIPCHKLYEDARTLAFLDIGPVSRGHALVLPRAHAVMLDELGADDATAIGQALVKVGRAIVRAVGAEAWNVLQNNGEMAGQLVPHVHFHIVPRFNGDGFSYRWNPRKLSDDDAAALKDAIARELGSRQ